MNCRKAQEIIISGYSDNELKLFWKKACEAHLDACSDCREFLSVFKRSVVEPFKNTAPVNAPDYLWYRIKDKIAAVKPAPSRHGLFDIFVKVPRPIFAATAVILLVTINLLVLGVVNLNRNDNSPVSMLSYVEEINSGNTDNPADFGTEIEKTFL
jgi:hypothetical protein